MSLVVQTDGSTKSMPTALKSGPVDTNGTWTSITLPHRDLGQRSRLHRPCVVGRNGYDGWSTYNGYIGDVFVYKVALSDAERQQLETDMTSKFMTGGATT